MGHSLRHARAHTAEPGGGLAYRGAQDGGAHLRGHAAALPRPADRGHGAYIREQQGAVWYAEGGAEDRLVVTAAVAAVTRYCTAAGMLCYTVVHCCCG